MVAGTVLWSVLAAHRRGSADIEGFIEEAFVLESFKFDGPLIFRASARSAASWLVLVATLARRCCWAVLFNLISDLTGGTAGHRSIEEETTRPAPPRRR